MHSSTTNITCKVHFGQEQEAGLGRLLEAAHEHAFLSILDSI